MKRSRLTRAILQVLDSRYDISNEESSQFLATRQETVCMASGEYYGLVATVIVILCALLVFAVLAGIIYR